MKEKDLKEFLANELRMRYSDTSILEYDDNAVLHDILGSFSSADEKDLKIMNENIINFSRKLIINNSGTQENVLDNPFFQELLDKYNIRPTKEDFQKIRDKNLNICSVGYGGAMINIWYNIYLWAMELSETRIFKNLVIFDKDNIDFSNLPRIGKPIVLNYHSEISTEIDDRFTIIPLLKKVAIIDVEKELTKKRQVITFAQWLTDEHIKVLNNKNYIIVGAPNLDTRRLLRDMDASFYFIGHSDYEVEISYQPEISSNLANETYGSIDIPVLLINMHLAAAAFIKHLASDKLPNQGEKILEINLKTEKENADE